MDIQTQKNILDVFRSLIEMSQRRGCWHAHELEHVGMTYNQVSAILNELNKTETEQPQQAPAETEQPQQAPAEPAEPAEPASGNTVQKPKKRNTKKTTN